MAPKRQTIKCPDCGAANPATQKFCRECGRALQAALASSAKTAKSPPSPATPQPQTGSARVSVRNWFRSMRPREPAAAMVEPTHVVGFAAALRRARDERLIPEDRVRAVHRLLQVEGPGRTMWTVGLGSLGWNRLSNGQWEPAEPPDYVSLNGSMLNAIAALVAAASKAPEAARRPIAAARSRAPALQLAPPPAAAQCTG